MDSAHIATATRPSPWRTAVSCSAIALCALTAGHVSTFPLYGPAIQRQLSLTTSQTSILASVGNLALYLTVAPWGALADRRGPGSVSLAGAVFVSIGFLLMAATLAGTGRAEGAGSAAGAWLRLVAFGFLTGISSATYYIAAVSTSARAFPSYPGLAVSAPCALYGLSPLFLSVIGNAAFSPRQLGPLSGGSQDGFDVVGYFCMLAGLAGAAGVFGWLSLDAALPPGDGAGPLAGPGPASPAAGEVSEATPLVVAKPASGPMSLSRFLAEPTAWIMGSVLLLGAGPGDMTIACLGSVVEALFPPAAPASAASALAIRAKHVQVLSAVNTSARVLVGWLSDRWARRIGGSAWLAAATAGYACVCAFTALGLADEGGLWVLSLGTGLSYGTIFTIMPSLTSTLWPLSDFGRNWGLLTFCTAGGAFMFTVLFGELFDLADSAPGGCAGRGCFRGVFLVCAVAEVCALGLVGVLRPRLRRGAARASPECH